MQKRKYTCDIMRVIQFGDIEDTVHVCPKELSLPRKYKTHQEMRERTELFYDDIVHAEASAYAH